MTTRRKIALLFTFFGLALGLSAQPPRKLKKPKEEKEPVTQKLEIPREPPMAISAETGKLVFHVSPLSGKGLLSQQVRDALKALDRANGGATIVKLRAFVAGAGDLRRVATIVSEEFSGRKIPLPVVSTIQVGALPLEGAQVVIESVSVDKKVVNPLGLAFFSAQSLGQLQTDASDAGVSMLRVTCFLSSLDDVQNMRSQVNAAFPAAAADFVQLTRAAGQPVADCEGVGRAAAQGRETPSFVLVSGPKLVFTGLLIAFHDNDSDIRLALERMNKALETQHSSYRDVVFGQIYSLNQSVGAKSVPAFVNFLNDDKTKPLTVPRGTAEVFEGLPALDAIMAIEVVAALAN